MTSHDAQLARATLLPSSVLEQRSMGAPQVPHPGADDAYQVVLGDAGTCADIPTQLLLLTDDSASLTASGGNDPLARRYEEARRSISHVARSCRCRQERVAVIPFDQPSERTLRPQPLTKLGVRRIHSALRSTGREPGSSSLAPALDLAERQAEQLPDGFTDLVVLSDFLLTDRQPDHVLSRLVEYPGRVHAVVLGARPPGQLHDASTVKVTVLTPPNPRPALSPNRYSRV